MLGMLAKLMPLAAVGGVVAGGSGDMTEVGMRAINMALEIKTSMEMRNIVQNIRIDMAFDEGIPKDIVAYARENMDSQGTDPGLDAWGSEWQIEKNNNGTFLLSCGPDARCGNEDDLFKIIIDKSGRFRSRKYP